MYRTWARLSCSLNALASDELDLSLVAAQQPSIIDTTRSIYLLVYHWHLCRHSRTRAATARVVQLVEVQVVTRPCVVAVDIKPCTSGCGDARGRWSSWHCWPGMFRVCASLFVETNRGPYHTFYLQQTQHSHTCKFKRVVEYRDTRVM